jgi:hypothetical protein
MDGDVRLKTVGKANKAKTHLPSKAPTKPTSVPKTSRSPSVSIPDRGEFFRAKKSAL